MPRSKIIALMTLIGFAFCIAAIGDAVAGEKFKLRTIKYQVKWEQIDVGDEEGHIIAVHEAKGIVSNMEGKSFGDGWVLRHVGLFDGNVGHGYEEVTDKDGDKYYSKWEGKAVAENRWEGEYIILKGTGKFEGIRGKGSWTAYVVAPMPAMQF